MNTEKANRSKLSVYCLLLLVSFNACSQAPAIVRENNVENAYPRLSADGRRILYQSNRDGHWQLYSCDINGKDQNRLTSDKFNNNFPDWSNDNEWIAFVSDRDGNEELYMMRTDGSGQKRITQDPARDIHPYFSPDGKYILFNSDRNGNQFDIYRYDLENGRTERLTNTPANETCARYAPDMKSIVLLKNNEAMDGVYLLNLADFLSVDLSKTPGVLHGWPMFSHDGKWVYYSSMENSTYSIFRIRPDGNDKQQLTFAKQGEEHARVSVSRDGKFMIYNLRSGGTISIVSMPLGNQ